MVTIFRVSPGYVLLRHSHDCSRFEVVLGGSMTDEHGDVLTAGSVMTAQPNEMYGPSVAATVSTLVESRSSWNE